MILFGTGKYYETSDNVVGSSPQPEAFYGLWDKNTKVLSTDQITDTANLQAQSILFEGTATSTTGISSSMPLRITSATSFCYTATGTGCTSSSTLKRGWMLPLLSPPSPGVANGERVVSTATLAYKTIIFSTAIPTSSACSAGGSSWLMLLDALTGTPKSGPVIDLFSPTGASPDGKFDNSDLLSYSSKSVSASGINQGIGITGSPNVMSGGTSASIFTGGSGGGTGNVSGNLCALGATCAGSRQSWKQLL